MNTNQQPQSAPGNRITFTSQQLPNGTLNLNTGHPAGSTIITSQLPTTTTIKTITTSGATGTQHHGLVQHQQMLQSQTQPGQPAQQQSVGATQTQTLVIKSNHAVTLPAALVSSAPGIVTMTKTINQGNQPMLNSMIPANVVMGVRPPNTPQQKNVHGNALGRVVIGNTQIVGTRPQSPSITLSTLTQGQAPAILLKTDAGFQIVRVGTTTSTNPVTQTIGTNSNNPTQIRLQTVPAAVSRITGPPIALRKTIVKSSTTTTLTTSNSQQQQPKQHLQQKATTTTKQIKQNTIATTSSANNIIVNSVATTNSTPHVFTSQANISLQQPGTNVTTISQQQQQTQPQQQHQPQALQQQTQHLHPQPQITQIQTISAQQNNQQSQQQIQPPQQQQQSNIFNNTIVNSTSSGVVATSVATTTTTGTPTSPQTNSPAQQGNIKEKCRKFLANLIDLSTREPKPVEKNVRNLLQELVNANVEPEQFCQRLERLLNASPQPCLIGFLKKSLPLLRQALLSKELVIEGLKPPPAHVVYTQNAIQQNMFPKIQAQIRPISQNQSTTIGQTQVRVVTPQRLVTPTIANTNKLTTSIRIQNNMNGQILNNSQIRGQIPAMIQQTQSPTQTLPTTAVTVAAPSPNGANSLQIRGPNVTQITRPATVQIRANKGKSTIATTSTPGIVGTPPTLTTPSITHVKVGQTQIKTIPATSSITTKPPSLTAINISVPSSISPASNVLSTINSVAANSTTMTTGSSGTVLPVPSLPIVPLPSNISTISTISNSSSNSNLIDIKSATPTPKIATKLTAASMAKPTSKKKKDVPDKDKDEKSSIGSLNSSSSSFFQHSSSVSSTLYGDDDINDVAAMGGVNLAEESQRILGCTENIGTQIRSCKDEVFLHLPALQARVKACMVENGMEEPSQDIAVLISHACQEHLKNIVEKLAVIAEHRIDVIKTDPRYEITKDVRGQIKFLEELDKTQQKRQEELEREMLLRAAKSRSKIEDPEQAKMKARAKEMQRAEMEELRQRDANMTALQAIGPRKKLKLDEGANGSGSNSGGGVLGGSGSSSTTLRPRIKRVNLRDMIYYMEQDRNLCRSELLYKAYLK